ncbi:hypothetical protein HOLleu_23440 [Holothuria leucospilota]|uniref:Uncharacterized protein n=1 Tax=Holothuria leucospilota TaxID=206669 RepID=A0A9Q1BVC9_HOLLE|nr:hypothetical protein HOLleu_23440 [Holothuria leucospilota]
MRLIQAMVILCTRGLILGGRNDEAEFYYLGCYVNEQSEDSQLFDSFSIFATERDVDKCSRRCGNLKLLYFAFTNNCNCFCGNSSSNFEQFRKSQESYCEEDCTTISTSSYMKVYEVRCKTQQNITDGFMEVIQKSVSFKCKDGFKLKGREQLNCNIDPNGGVSWDGDPPSCVAAGLSPGLKFFVIVLLILPPILSIVLVFVTCQ